MTANRKTWTKPSLTNREQLQSVTKAVYGAPLSTKPKLEIMD